MFPRTLILGKIWVSWNLTLYKWPPTWIGLFKKIMALSRLTPPPICRHPQVIIDEQSLIRCVHANLAMWVDCIGTIGLRRSESASEAYSPKTVYPHGQICMDASLMVFFHFLSRIDSKGVRTKQHLAVFQNADYISWSYTVMQHKVPGNPLSLVR